MTEVKHVMVFYMDGTVERFDPVFNELPGTVEAEPKPKKPKKRAQPRRRCTTCEELVDRDEFENHKLGHSQPLVGPPAPDRAAEAFDGDISVFDKEDE